MSELKGCKEYCDLISDYLDGEINENECSIIEAHLRECPLCCVAYRSLFSTIAVCAEAVPADMPEDVTQRLKSFLREHCAHTKLEKQEENIP